MSWKNPAVCRCGGKLRPERQEVDYPANTKVYQEVVEHLPEKKHLILIQIVTRSCTYQAAADSIDPSKLGYTDDEKDYLSL